MLAPAYENLSGIRLIVATPPAEEPVTTAEAKLHLRVDIPDDDALIGSLIVAARLVCETYTKRSLVATTWDLFLDGGFPWSGGYYNRLIRQQGPGPMWLPQQQGAIELLRPPVQSVQWVKYVDYGGVLQTIDPSLYDVAPGTPARIQAAFGQVWPLARPQLGAVQVRYTSGYGAAAAVPEVFKAAMKLLIGNWYENREAVVTGTIAADLPMGVRALLDSESWGSYT